MISIRLALVEDLEAIHRVWWSTEGHRRPNPWFAHVLRTGEMVVAVQDDEVVGFAGRRQIGSTAVVSDCFVEARWHGRGIGTAMLEPWFSVSGARMTLASADPKARALYTRFGMKPIVEVPYFEASATEMPIPVEPALPYPVSARDLEHLLGDLNGHVVSVGNGSVAVVTNHSIETSVLGLEDDADAVVQSLLAYVGGVVEFQISVEHRAYADRAWKRTDFDLLMATTGADLPDWTRISFNGDLLDLSSSAPTQHRPTGDGD